MTDKPTPTDAELKALWQIHAADIGGIFHYARAVLAKWGTPQPSPVGPPAPRVEPVAWLNPWRADQVTTDYDAYGRRGIPLYTAPQPAKATPTNVWQQAVDHALVSAHLGVAGEVTAEEATKILNDLICWNIQVATDPLTNGGKVLVSANAVAAINSPEATQHTQHEK